MSGLVIGRHDRQRGQRSGTPVRWAVMSCLLAVAALLCAANQPQDKPESNAAQKQSASVNAEAIAPMVAQAVQRVIAMQEGEDHAEWPYEGVYRVQGKIPIGYRIGGTAICALMLIQAPGYSDDAERQSAVSRAVSFIVRGKDDPLMSPDYEGGYDVRGWGYTYGLTFLLRLKAMNLQPKDMGDAIDASIRFFVDAICKTEISKVGGWNYARGRRREAVSPPATFMTAPTLQALFEAKKQGFAVDDAVVNRALDSLERARTQTGSFQYAGVNGERSREAVPGAVGRMLVSEVTLHLAGRSSIANVRSAIDAFIVHWSWLEKRRAQSGTHIGPYSIAPYYFYFAHYYAAQAIEMLPEHERGEYRRRFREILLSTRSENGTWNDRVFERSANYGTAMAAMALIMPDLPRPAAWQN